MTLVWRHPFGWNPILNGAIVPILVGAVLAFSGCSNRQSAVNPFVASDCVPPPGTRSAPPAAAQPYYQGAPAVTSPPVSTFSPGAAPPNYPQQGGFAPAPSPHFAATQLNQSSVQQANVQQATFQAPIEPSQTSSPVVQTAHNESSVAVPTDSQSLRIMAPEPAPFIAQAQPAPMARQMGQPVVQPMTQPAIAGQPRPVQMRAIAPTTSGVTNQTTYSAGSPAFSPAPQSSDGLPWNSGSAPRGGTLAPPTYPQQPAQSLVPVVAPTPRVRLPGYPAPQQTFVVPAGTSASYGQVQITHLPTSGPSPPSVATPQVTNDGFRARSANY